MVSTVIPAASPVVTASLRPLAPLIRFQRLDPRTGELKLHHGFPTGRVNAEGEPLYGFLPLGARIDGIREVSVQGRKYHLDTTHFEFSKRNPARPAIETVRPDGMGLTPEWAKTADGASLVNPRQNGHFLAVLIEAVGPAIVKRLAAELLRSIRPTAFRSPRGTPLGERDLRNLRVSFVRCHQHSEGPASATDVGRVIGLAFDALTGEGISRFIAHVADPFFVDPSAGGRFLPEVEAGTARQPTTFSMLRSVALVEQGPVRSSSWPSM